MEDSNKPLMKYFEKFSNVNNYNFYKNKLQDLSKYRFLGVIKLKDLEIPRIGPNDELKNFHKLLYDFNNDQIKEIKFVIKSYEEDTIDSTEECLDLINIILKNNLDSKHIELITRIKYDVENDTKLYEKEYTSILQINKDDFLINLLMSFLIRRII